MKLLIMLKVAGFIIRYYFLNYEQKYLVACFNCQVGASCHTCFIFILWYNLFILIIIIIKKKSNLVSQLGKTFLGFYILLFMNYACFAH